MHVRFNVGVYYDIVYYCIHYITYCAILCSTSVPWLVLITSFICSSIDNSDKKIAACFLIKSVVLATTSISSTILGSKCLIYCLYFSLLIIFPPRVHALATFIISFPFCILLIIFDRDLQKLSASNR